MKRLHILDFFSEAISSYILQSFMPNTGTKGFPLLSGLVVLVALMGNYFTQKESGLKKIAKKQRFTVSRKIAEVKKVSFGNDVKLDFVLTYFRLEVIYLMDNKF